MYISEDSLCYENQCRCCSIWRLKLSDIHVIAIVNDGTMNITDTDVANIVEHTRARFPRYQIPNLSPGLVIGAYPNVCVLVNMLDAAIFGAKLGEAISGCRNGENETGEKKVLDLKTEVKGDMGFMMESNHCRNIL